MRIGGTNGVGGPQNVHPDNAKGQAPKPNARNEAAQTDRVEISDAARVRDAISRVPDIRPEKISQAREMIAAGEMDTPERMDVAVDRLLKEFLEQ